MCVPFSIEVMVVLPHFIRCSNLGSFNSLIFTRSLIVLVQGSENGKCFIQMLVEAVVGVG